MIGGPLTEKLSGSAGRTSPGGGGGLGAGYGGRGRGSPSGNSGTRHSDLHPASNGFAIWRRSGRTRRQHENLLHRTRQKHAPTRNGRVAATSSSQVSRSLWMVAPRWVTRAESACGTCAVPTTVEISVSTEVGTGREHGHNCPGSAW